MSHTTPAHAAFNLPPLVQSYLALKKTQSRLRVEEAALRPQVEHWIGTLPKQSIELEPGGKLKLATVTRRVVTLASVRASMEQFVLTSSMAATAEEAKAFAQQCAAFVWEAREVKRSHQLQRTTARPASASATSNSSRLNAMLM
jgi:hypothetical protein